MHIEVICDLFMMPKNVMCFINFSCYLFVILCTLLDLCLFRMDTDLLLEYCLDLLLH